MSCRGNRILQVIRQRVFVGHLIKWEGEWASASCRGGESDPRLSLHSWQCGGLQVLKLWSPSAGLMR